MRLNEQRFLILASLARGPMHGYAIADEIRQLSDGHHTPRPGSLYHAIDKLVSSDLVIIDREDTVDGRMRRYYRLTETGIETLTAEASRRAQTAQAAIARMNPSTRGLLA